MNTKTYVYACVNVHLRVFVPLHYIFPAAVSEEQVRWEGVWEPLADRHQQLWKTQWTVFDLDLIWGYKE